MKAIVQDTYGNPDVLRLHEAVGPEVTAGPGTLVSVRQMTGGILQGWPPATPYPRISRGHRAS